MSLALQRIRLNFLVIQRAFRQFNAVIFMKQAYRVALLVLFITETIMYVRDESCDDESSICFLGLVSMLLKPIEINQRSMIAYRVVP